MINIRTFKNSDQLVAHTEERLRATLAVPGTLMLSGGATPYAVYDRLAGAPCPVHPKRSLFLSDERMVPCESPQSNTGNLMPMLQALQCEERFIRIATDGLPDEASSRFACELECLEQIDFGLLGIGSDGHTAGFFTLEAARARSGALTLHTLRPDGLMGISVSPVLLHRVKEIIILVTGESKRAIINTLLTKPETIPAGLALADHPRVELWTDIH